MTAKPLSGFFIDSDSDSHWYVIPVEYEQEWSDWCDIDTDDERSWSPPEFATPIGGSPNRVRFTDWRLR